MRFQVVAYHADTLGKEYERPYFIKWYDAGTSVLGNAGYHVCATPKDPRSGYEPGVWVLFVCVPDGPVEDEETLKANLLMLAETGLWKELK